MTDENETRNWKQLADDNARLRADNSDLLIQLAQAKQTIADLEHTKRAVHLRTRAYQIQPPPLPGEEI